MLLQTAIAVATCGGILISPPAFGQESPISKAGFTSSVFLGCRS